MQLEKIRAMAAELKPSRGRSRGNGRGIRSGAVSRGSLKPRGRCRILRTEVCYFYHLCSVTFFCLFDTNNSNSSPTHYIFLHSQCPMEILM